MTDTCEWKHEGFCIVQNEHPKFQCPHAKGEIPKCTATEADFVDGCIECESAPATHDEYCEKCWNGILEEARENEQDRKFA